MITQPETQISPGLERPTPPSYEFAEFRPTVQLLLLLLLDILETLQHKGPYSNQLPNNDGMKIDLNSLLFVLSDYYANNSGLRFSFSFVYRYSFAHISQLFNSLFY